MEQFGACCHWCRTPAFSNATFPPKPLPEFSYFLDDLFVKNQKLTGLNSWNLLLVTYEYFFTVGRFWSSKAFKNILNVFQGLLVLLPFWELCQSRLETLLFSLCVPDFLLLICNGRISECQSYRKEDNRQLVPLALLRVMLDWFVRSRRYKILMADGHF